MMRPAVRRRRARETAILGEPQQRGGLLHNDTGRIEEEQPAVAHEPEAERLADAVAERAVVEQARAGATERRLTREPRSVVHAPGGEVPRRSVPEAADGQGAHEIGG